MMNSLPAKRLLSLIQNVLPFILWMAIIFVMSTDFGSNGNMISWILRLLHIISPDNKTQASDVINFGWVLRKCAHAAEYGILTWLGYRAVRYGLGKPISSAMLFGFLFAIFYAATDEFHQSFIPTRDASFIDIGIDALGAVLCYLILRLSTKKANWEREAPPEQRKGTRSSA